jgi:hypothetical protein
MADCLSHIWLQIREKTLKERATFVVDHSKSENKIVLMNLKNHLLQHVGYKIISEITTCSYFVLLFVSEQLTEKIVLDRFF